MNAAELARACADAMWAEDNASRGLGMRLLAVAPGTAELAMSVTERMVNGHGLCHGGFIFTLADSAFAFACNTHNTRTVAHQCAVTFVSSAHLGDELTARASERHRAGRSGIYDITVTRADGSVVAEFRGHSRAIKGELLPGVVAT
ncbi:acyl-coenzyme A thioesterase PaaI [Variibacter gotjawalensis]|uniref:Acyl-coenzyme A thioesterase PaaI n=2 Tax=Variibacter gotjawalensis TaxID=1333996 RepID=A0A0S3PNK7_9BRAD|nr:(3S)-malyl-CoA thioesterase [Variibacter gotjawalensis]BAT57497.1 acyl-coenzyme A thioesterase PaaI [Variibacter gotjawalensis]